jgi:ubiquinol-cytochrome c reductase cytochrome b subunit
MMKRLTDWLDERIKIRAHMQAHLTGYTVPKNLTVWHSLGAVLIFLLFTQIVTGILLTVYYVPDASKAFDSVMYINNEVPYGWFIRRLHGTCANVFIFVLFLHMLSTLVMGAYKKPRELQWMTGVVLLGAGLFAALSGYLLPWSQLSYWATTVATKSVETLPFFGDQMADWLRGGDTVSAATLGRFYALHIWVIPLTFFVVIGAHLFFMRQTSIAPLPWEKPPGKKIPFYPHFVLEDLSVIYFFLGVVMVLVFVFPQWSFPPDMWEAANPLETPAHIKPEWYFLPSYQFLKLVPSETLGVLAQVLFGLALFFLPFLDRGAQRDPGKRPLFLILFIGSVIGLIALGVWGKMS